MKKSIVIGATGTIGRAVFQLFKEKGLQVLPVSRSTEQHMDLEDPQSISRFFSETEPLDVIVCAAGNASFGHLSKLTDEQIHLGLRSKLMGQVNICRRGLNVLKPNGLIILTGGIFAHQPWPETTNIAMVNAALEGFVKALALEMTEGRRILIVHPPMIKETALAMGMDASQSPSASEIAFTYLNGLEGNENGKPLFFENENKGEEAAIKAKLY